MTVYKLWFCVESISVNARVSQSRGVRGLLCNISLKISQEYTYDELKKPLINLSYILFYDVKYLMCSYWSFSTHFLQ